MYLAFNMRMWTYERITSSALNLKHARKFYDLSSVARNNDHENFKKNTFTSSASSTTCAAMVTGGACLASWDWPRADASFRWLNSCMNKWILAPPSDARRPIGSRAVSCKAGGFSKPGSCTKTRGEVKGRFSTNQGARDRSCFVRVYGA